MHPFHFTSVLVWVLNYMTILMGRFQKTLNWQMLKISSYPQSTMWSLLICSGYQLTFLHFQIIQQKVLFVSCFISFTRIKIVSQIFRNGWAKIREVITILNQIAKLWIAVLRVRHSLLLSFVLIQVTVLRNIYVLLQIMKKLI